MAATKRNAMNILEARKKIQTTQLINRLTDHVVKGTKMESTQVTAALGLLKKAIPDLSAATLEHSGSIGLGDILGELDGRSKGLPKDQG